MWLSIHTIAVRLIDYVHGVRLACASVVQWCHSPLISIDGSIPLCCSVPIIVHVHGRQPVSENDIMYGYDDRTTQTL